MLFARVADGIAYPGGCVWSDVVTMCGRWNGTEYILLFQFQFWTVAQNLIPSVRQMVLAYVFV